jgi:hypothetical protein
MIRDGESTNGEYRSELLIGYRIHPDAEMETPTAEKEVAVQTPDERRLIILWLSSGVALAPDYSFDAGTEMGTQSLAGGSAR